MKEQIRVLTYERVSTEDSLDSLRAQIVDNRNYILNQGLQEVAGFARIQRTGSPEQEKTVREMQEVIHANREDGKAIRFLIVFQLDRLCRKNSSILDTFFKEGVQIIESSTGKIIPPSFSIEDMLYAMRDCIPTQLGSIKRRRRNG